MKIAYVLSTCAKFGPFIVASDIVNNIANSVEPIDIYYLKESKEKLFFNAQIIKIGFEKKIDFSQYDVVHSHGFLGDLYTFLNRSSIRGKWITTLHQKIKPDYSMSYNRVVGKILEKLWVWIVGKSNCVVCLTGEMVDYYLPICKSKLIVKIYNGTSPKSSDRPIPHLEKTQIDSLRSRFKIIGISANLIYRKGIDRVIQALSLPSGQDFALIVIGDGDQKNNLIELATILNVSDRCVFLGYKQNAIDYFKYFDVYMMSSRSEGFGLCVIEAASQKVPVVCNDLTVYRELFAHEVVRFNLDDTESLNSAVRESIRDKNILSDILFLKYNTCYSAEVMAKNYLQCYCEMTEKK